MNKTQTFEKLDKLTEGLRDISGLSDKEQKKTPERKKWRAAIDSLPKEEKNEYYDRAYQKSQEDRIDKVGLLYQKEIRPNTSCIHFWLGEKVVKEEKLFNEKQNIEEQFSKKETPPIQNIGVPEIVDIDYSDIKDISTAKNGERLRPYRDGFLIIREDNPKSYHAFTLSHYKDTSKAEAKIFFHSLTFGVDTHYYLSSADIKNVKEHKNNLSFYFVFKRAYKNKAFKITFKNNKHVDYIFNLFEKQSKDQKFNKITDIISKLPSSLTTNYIESLGVLEKYELLLDAEKGGYDSVETRLKKDTQHFSKEKMLKTGYHHSIFAKFLIMIEVISSILKSNKEGLKGSLLDLFKDLDPDNYGVLTKRLLEKINEGDVTTKDMIPLLGEAIAAGRFIKIEHKLHTKKLSDDFLNLVVSYRCTEEGTSLPTTGKINVEDATEIDCFYYWNYINVFNLINGCLDKKDFPLLLDEGKIFNENEFYKHVHEFSKYVTLSPFRNPNEALNLDPETKTQISEILKEAMEQTTGLLIPYNACVGLKDDPIFKYIRFIEYEKYIAIFAHDYNDRFISEMYVKGEDEFRYWLYNSGQIFDSKVAESSKLLYLKLAACIRDWKILIERDSSMSYQGHRIPSGVPSGKPRHMYLPRVTYKRSNSKEQKRREKVFFSESRKFNGDRRAHVRKLHSGMKASKLQMLLASSENIYVPEGHTFVRKSIWGKVKMGKREIKYRDTCLNGLFYGSDHEIKKAKTINELGPGNFEEFSEKYITKLGWEVIKRNNYDGGIDIRALKEFKDGTIKKLIVQCKHPAISKKPVGPNVIRELIGASKLEESEYEKVLMVITSSKFTFGAREAAAKENIELIDGDKLLGA